VTLGGAATWPLAARAQQASYALGARNNAATRFGTAMLREMKARSANTSQHAGSAEGLP